MTMDRPYRGAMSMDEAVAELERCSGSQFDPEVVAVLTGVLRARDASQGESRLAQPAG
jgi:HD-GYP domain-containing protein (c-di-GMP phosphodiesterase class II)